MHKIDFKLHVKKLINFKILIVLPFWLSFSITGTVAQTTLNSTSITEGNIYALIIGISDYKDDSIKKLRFAHRDAELFAQYLSSPAGGSVPKEHIKLLTNQNATISNIYTEKQWLEENAKKNDLVFFYFSGHGDVESSIYKLGFLLAYDTPFKNYLNNAVRIEDINIMANTLSIQKNVNTILITDACHSGKLAGSDNRGTALVGDQLSKVEQKEIRIASCEANQLSEEDEFWGGGRGVFSYYLINGLKGLADSGDEDGIVTLEELSTYLTKKVKSDVLNLKQKEQKPVVKGEDNTKLAIVNEEELKKVKATIDTPGTASMVDGSKSVDFEQQISDRYFYALSAKSLVDKIDFFDWNKKSTSDVIDLAIEKFGNPLKENPETVAYLKSCQTDGPDRRTYGKKLAALIHNEIQKVVNKYLLGDREELQRRQAKSNGIFEFTEYPEMIEVAMKFIDTTNYLHHILQVNYHYFKGISIRLKPKMGNTALENAIKEQLNALKLEPNAAYIQNELGNLYTAKAITGDKDSLNLVFEDALFCYSKACELVPKWSLPWSNISNTYYFLGLYKHGVSAAKKAISLQADYSKSYTNLGKNYEELEKFVMAEDNFLKAIVYNDKDTLSYDKMANFYVRLTEYEGANLYFLQANKLKIAFSAKNDSSFVSEKLQRFAKDKGAYSDAEKYLQSDDFTKARKSLDSTIKTNPDKKNYYSLSRLEAMRNNQEEAFIHLNKAIDKGFDYTMLVIRDKAFNEIKKNNSKWQKIIARLPKIPEM